MRRTFALIAAAAATIALAGCAAGGTPASPSPDASSRPPFQTTTPGPVGPTGTPVEVPDARWAAIADDLATREIMGIPELVSAEAVTFTDGSLGCPQPGQSYTQALVDGMRVIVAVEGVPYDYRFGSDDTPRLCAR